MHNKKKTSNSVTDLFQYVTTFCSLKIAKKFLQKSKKGMDVVCLLTKNKREYCVYLLVIMEVFETELHNAAYGWCDCCGFTPYLFLFYLSMVIEIILIYLWKMYDEFQEQYRLYQLVLMVVGVIGAASLGVHMSSVVTKYRNWAFFRRSKTLVCYFFFGKFSLCERKTLAVLK